MEDNKNNTNEVEILEVEKNPGVDTNNTNEPILNENKNKIDVTSIILLIVAIIQIIAIVYVYTHQAPCEPQGPPISTYHETSFIYKEGDNNE